VLDTTPAEQHLFAFIYTILGQQWCCGREAEDGCAAEKFAGNTGFMVIFRAVSVHK